MKEHSFENAGGSFLSKAVYTPGKITATWCLLSSSLLSSSVQAAAFQWSQEYQCGVWLNEMNKGDGWNLANSLFPFIVAVDLPTCLSVNLDFTVWTTPCRCHVDGLLTHLLSGFMMHVKSLAMTINSLSTDLAQSLDSQEPPKSSVTTIVRGWRVWNVISRANHHQTLPWKRSWHGAFCLVDSVQREVRNAPNRQAKWTKPLDNKEFRSKPIWRYRLDYFAVLIMHLLVFTLAGLTYYSTWQVKMLTILLPLALCWWVFLFDDRNYYHLGFFDLSFFSSIKANWLCSSHQRKQLKAP